MADVSPNAQLEQLMSELSWLRRLARALVRDPADADDLVQETWLVAAEHAPTDARPVKPWLSRVALNLVRMRSRTAKRRRAREATTEPPAARAPTPDELVSRLEAQRLVVDELLRLAEPYRSTVLLHYFEDLSCAEIARRQGVPDGTVRRRLKVARDELRGRLRAEEHQTGRCILAALSPLALDRGAATLGSKALGVVVMKKVLAVVVVIIGMFFAARALHGHGERAAEPVVASERPQGAAGRPPALPREAPAARVVVAVTDAAGPIAGATVRCAPADGEVIVVPTARDGTASIELAAGAWSIAASAEGHEPAAVRFEVVAGRDARVPLVLTAGGRALTGTVTDASGGAIPGVRIDAARLDARTKPGRAVAVAVTDRDGHYKLTAAGGQILVAASHPEYAPQTRYVDLGQAGATASFALIPGGVLEGVVRDAQTRQPIAGAAVRARHDASALELAEANERVAKADADGKFRLAGLRPGAYELSARAGGRSTRAPVRVALGVAEQQTDLAILVGATAAIRGKVVDETGAPVAAVAVRATDGNGERADATSDAAGRFVLEGLTQSRWMLRGTSDHHLAEGRATVDLKTSDVDGIVVHVRRGLVVEGHVEPREICDVELLKDERDTPFTHHEFATTSENGEFRLAPLAPGHATVTARCANGDEGHLDVTVAADAPARIVTVEPGGSIAGRVVDAAGAPTVGVTVIAEVVSPRSVMTIVNGAVTSGFQAITSTGGAFEIHGLAAATYRLAALDRGRPIKAKQATKRALATGQHATGVEIVVERPAGTIRGTVTGPDGMPIADAWITLHQTGKDLLDSIDIHEVGWVSMKSDGAGESNLPPALSDTRGQFELANVPHSRYQVLAEAQAGKLRGRAADITPDAEITITLAAVSSLRGTVHGAHGPSELFSVRLTGPTSDQRSFADGAFEFPRVDPGDYTLEVTSSDGTGHATAHVADGAAAVDIALVANATVTGRLVDPAGNPVPGMNMTLLADRDVLQIELHDPPAISGPDGRFSVEAQAGKRMLVVLGHTPTTRRGLALEAGKAIDVGDVIVNEPE
jgi:RNA polymerase sigma-70 factor (ECF subfamily)